MCASSWARSRMLSTSLSLLCLTNLLSHLHSFYLPPPLPSPHLLPHPPPPPTPLSLSLSLSLSFSTFASLLHVCLFLYNTGIPFLIQYTDAGMYTCSTGGRPHKIPGSYGHYEQDAKTYAEWGIECEQYCGLIWSHVCTYIHHKMCMRVGRVLYIILSRGLCSSYCMRL